MYTFLHKLAPHKNLPTTIRFPRNMYQDILEKELILNGTLLITRGHYFLIY